MKTTRPFHLVIWPVLLGVGLVYGFGTSTKPVSPGSSEEFETVGIIESVEPEVAQDEIVADASSLTELEKSIECVKGLSETFKALSQGVGPAVASVTSHVETSRGTRQLAQGSGVVLTAEGLLVTNYHVVAGGKVFRASFEDGRDLEAAIVGTDSDSDLAFLQLEGDDFAYARLAEREAQVGEFVLALGNPFGMGHTVTSGIVSGLGRRDIGLQLLYEDFIQTNALINPGNSGGPLIDLFGEVLGLNTAIEESGRRGISYSIPAKMIRRVQKDIIEFGYVRRGYLGVVTESLNSGRRSRSRDRSRSPGRRVVRVVEESPASRAELEVGDVLMSVEGKPLISEDDLLLALEAITPGTTIELVLQRDDVEVKRQVVVGERARD